MQELCNPRAMSDVTVSGGPEISTLYVAASEYGESPEQI